MTVIEPTRFELQEFESDDLPDPPQHCGRDMNRPTLIHGVARHSTLYVCARDGCRQKVDSGPLSNILMWYS